MAAQSTPSTAPFRGPLRGLSPLAFRSGGFVKNLQRKHGLQGWSDPSSTLSGARTLLGARKEKEPKLWERVE